MATMTRVRACVRGSRPRVTLGAAVGAEDMFDPRGAVAAHRFARYVGYGDRIGHGTGLLSVRQPCARARGRSAPDVALAARRPTRSACFT